MSSCHDLSEAASDWLKMADDWLLLARVLSKEAEPFPIQDALVDTQGFSVEFCHTF